jgi:membrane protein DedA with SNARE-associated domain
VRAGDSFGPLDADAAAPGRPHPSRRTLALILGPIVAVVIVGTLGNMFHPRLLRDHPLWLVAMEPRNRYLLLVAEKVDFVPYLLVATVRRLISDPLFYLIGLLYGDAGVRWIESRLGDDVGLVRAMERGFRKAAPLMVFLFPGAIVCVLAGATGMSPVVFLACNVIGTVTVVSLLYRFAEVFDGPLGAVNGFYARNNTVLTVISVVAVGFWIWDQRRRGKSELKSIGTMERELEEAGRDRAADAADGEPAADDAG